MREVKSLHKKCMFRSIFSTNFWYFGSIHPICHCHITNVMSCWSSHWNTIRTILTDNGILKFFQATMHGLTPNHTCWPLPTHIGHYFYAICCCKTKIKLYVMANVLLQFSIACKLISITIETMPLISLCLLHPHPFHPFCGIEGCHVFVTAFEVDKSCAINRYCL